jgi:hypothetical protein
MLRRYTTFDGVTILGQSDGIPDAEGHFMIRCRKLQQWRDIPVTFIPIDLLKLTHDLEGFKDPEVYPEFTYESKMAQIVPLAGDIEKYGLKCPIWVRRIIKGKDKGMFRVIEGHKRTFSLKLNAEKGVGDYDAPCRIMPQQPSQWIREHGYDKQDYSLLIF